MNLLRDKTILRLSLCVKGKGGHGLTETAKFQDR
jgi:hypothetical protein